MTCSTRNTLLVLAITLNLPLANAFAANSSDAKTTSSSSESGSLSDTGQRPAYGAGKTISGSETSQSSHSTQRRQTGKIGTSHDKTEVAIGESRERTYHNSKLDLEEGEVKAVIGAETQYNAVRVTSEVGAETDAAKVGDVDVARAYTGAKTESTIGAQAGASAGAEVNMKKLSDSKLVAEAGASTGVTVSGEATAGVEVVGINTDAKAESTTFVGASANAKSTVSKDGVNAKAGAFAGARAEGSVGGSVAGVVAKGTGEAWAGVGAEASGQAQFKNGKLTFGGEVGAGLGVGGKAGMEMTIDAGQTVKDAKQFGEASEGLARQVAPKVGSATHKVANNFARQQIEIQRKVNNGAYTAGKSATKRTTAAAKNVASEVNRIKVLTVKKPKVNVPTIRKPTIKKPTLKLAKKSKKKKSKKFPF